MEDSYGQACSRFTIIRWNSPVLAEWPTPYAKVQNLHDDEADNNVARNDLDCQVLLQTHTANGGSASLLRNTHIQIKEIIRQAVEHDQKTALYEPNRQELHLLGDENHL